jgi:hypothetical protein
VIPAEVVTSSRNTKRLKEPEIMSYPASFLEFNQLPGIFSNPISTPLRGITHRQTSLGLIKKDEVSNYDSRNPDKDPRSYFDDERYRYSITEFANQPLSNLGLAEKQMNSIDGISVDFRHLVEGGAKKKISSNFKIISGKSTPKKGTPTKENPKKVTPEKETPEKDDSNGEKLPL